MDTQPRLPPVGRDARKKNGRKKGAFTDGFSLSNTVINGEGASRHEKRKRKMDEY